MARRDYDKRAVDLVSCPFCGAVKSEPCRGAYGPVKATHSDRRRAAAEWVRANRGLGMAIVNLEGVTKLGLRR